MDDKDRVEIPHSVWEVRVGYKEVDGCAVPDWDTAELMELAYPTEARLVRNRLRQTRLLRQLTR